MFAFGAMTCAMFGLCSNLANVDMFFLPLGERAATHPVTAICMFGLGVAVFTIDRFKPSPLWRKLVAGSILCVCIVRVAEGAVASDVFSSDWGAFGPSGVVHGRFSIEAALTLGSFAVAGLFRQHRGQIGVLFLVAGLAVVFNTMLEMLYGLTFFNGDVGAFTVLGMLALSLAMVTMYVHRPFVRVSFLLSEIGRQTRIMATSVVIVPVLLGFYVYRIHGTNVPVDPVFAVVITVIVWSSVVMLMITSARHETSDAARRRAERTVRALSRRDALTGALNRFGIGEALNVAWMSHKTVGAKYGVVLIDLDHFKRINDTFGHIAGDDVLVRVGRALRPFMRSTDALGRWGGEEFLVLFEIQNRDDLVVVAERLRGALAQIQSPLLRAEVDQDRAISASLGVSDFWAGDEDANAAISRADAALYKAKANGRNRVACHFPDVAA